jgi:Fe-S-cluster containining protein
MKGLRMAAKNDSELSFFFTALKEEARTLIWETQANVTPQELIDSVKEELQALAPQENDPRSEAEIWRSVRETLLKAAYATRPHCVKCGTCCSKGSPVLVEEDLTLFYKDILKPEHIVTIRRGESTYSDKTQSVETAEHEYLKVKEQAFSKRCAFHNASTKECSIYENRPKQCRSQECWNPENAVQDDPVWLERKQLLKDTGPLWNLIQQHEAKCSHVETQRALTRLGATHGQTVEEVLDLLRVDHFTRDYLCKEFNLSPDTLDFFLGRPLKDLLPAYGLELKEEAGCFTLTPVSEK